MVFFALVILAAYLPQKAVLQRAVQFAAVTLATERGDPWLRFDEEDMQFYLAEYDELPNVYGAVLKGAFRSVTEEKGKAIVAEMAYQGLLPEFARRSVRNSGSLTVTCQVKNYVVYQEIVVIARQEIPLPVDFSLIGFPDRLTIVQQSRAVVQNGDEFVRNVDIAKDMVEAIDERLGISEKIESTKFFQGLQDILKYFRLK